MIQRLKNLFVTLDNRINPIAVKEMRQAVKSRYITLLLQFYLLVELLISCFYLLFIDTKNFTTGGSELFVPLMVLLFIANVVCVPVYTANRLSNEVRNNDAMFSTALTPMQIVRGKFLCGLFISLLLFSAAAPFMILTYLLRGLDISQILLTLYGTFLFIQVLNCFSIAFGSLNMSFVLRTILAVIIGISLFQVLLNLFIMFLSSVGSIDWEMFFISTLFFLFLGESLMTLAACLLSPVSFNRMTRPRIFATVSCFVLMAISLIYEYFTSSSDFVEAAFAFSLILAFIYLGIGLCERTTLSVRQIQQIPRNPILRILAYPFFTGVGSAIVWFFLMFFGILMFDIFFYNNKILESTVTLEPPFGFLVLCLFYSLCGMLIRTAIDYWRHNYLNHRLPEAPEIVIYPPSQKGFVTIAYTFFLIAVPTIIPLLFIFIRESAVRDFVFSFSPFCYLDYSQNNHIPMLSCFASIIMMIIYSTVSFIRYYSLGSVNAQSPTKSAADIQ